MCGTIFADEYNHKLVNWLQVPLNGEFTFSLVGYSQTFSVKRIKVGATNYNRMFDQLLAAFSKNGYVWVGTDVAPAATDVLGITILWQ
ncbi:MAG: hypothetical protein WBM07_13230, partial [Chitinivibrionales bacterium]